MKKIKLIFLIAALCLFAISCQKEQNSSVESLNALDLSGKNSEVNFRAVTTINVGGEASSEISAFDPKTAKLFVVNPAEDKISVFDLSDISNPVMLEPIAIVNGSPNSVDISHGMLAVAAEANPKQNPGRIEVYDTETQEMLHSYTVGALPDMVKFSPNGKFIVSANEGEPNDIYTVDPDGSVSIIEVHTGNVSTLTFEKFNEMEAELEAKGYRVFGPGADLAADTEPEYIAISDNSNYAWVSLQENNGIAKVNLETRTIEDIYPLGFKDYSLAENAIDASDKDGVKELKQWPVYGIYMPDGIKYIKVAGQEYIISANEGDSRDYDGYSEEARVEDITLDPEGFSAYDIESLQQKENLGRLKITTSMGDIDNDGDFDKLFAYGGRSFSIWSGDGTLVYDSANMISEITLAETPDRFNDDDGRSDDKGAEPETIETLQVNGNRHIMFVGCERTDQVLVFDISNPYSPQFIQILSNPGDEAPEGVLAISGKDSPSKKDLLIVSNEDSGTVTIYQNN